MINKTIRCCLAALITLTILQANGQSNAETLALLDRVSKKATLSKSISANFEYSLGNEEKADKYTGSFNIKGTRFKMEIDETIVFSNGKTRWVYLKESNEVNISNIEKSEDLEPEERFLVDPMSLYTVYKTGFKISSQGTETLDGKSFNIIDLTPVELNKPYFKIRLWIDNSDNLYAVKYFQKNGERLMLKITKITTDQKLKDTDFEFNPANYPGVEVIDLR